MVLMVKARMKIAMLITMITGMSGQRRSQCGNTNTDDLGDVHVHVHDDSSWVTNQCLFGDDEE
jgi:hypothetical protein